MFDDAKMPTALLDQFTHHCHIVETRNDPRRFRNGTGGARNAPSPEGAARSKSKTKTVDALE
ncbi:ATP-binding protein [Paraburkholderia aspalathi]|uniref:ATP-binding protein n=1 Tax=Paraburkholderia aspalathi TaxID=1324617 RepID=UPI0035591202